MARGQRTLDADERRILVDALMRAASDTRTVREAWNYNGAIAKPLKLSDEQVARILFHWDRIIAVQQQLAAEISDAKYELRLIEKESP